MPRVNGRFVPPTSAAEPVRKRSGSRPLVNGAPRMFSYHGGTLGRWYSQQFAALLARFGPFDAMTAAYAASVSALFVTFKADSAALNLALEARRHGKGRRPNATAIARLEKRQGLAWQSYDSALRRLEELAPNRNGHGGPTLADVMRGDD